MDGIGGILSGVGSLVDAGTNIYNSVNSKKIADENLKFSKEQYDYQKRLQQTIFDREDNAVQRRVADLKAAGLSPVLAAGSGAGAGQAVSTVAPHAETPEINIGLGEKVQAVLNAKSALQQIQNQKEQNNLVKAQKSYYDAQVAKVAQESANLETANATQQFNLDVAKQEFADYLYNRQFDVRQGKKITKDYSGGYLGVGEQLGDRFNTITDIVSDTAKKGSESVKKASKSTGSWIKKQAKRFVNWAKRWYYEQGHSDDDSNSVWGHL